MSRIGNAPVKVPPKVEVALSAGEISVKGPLGTLSRKFSDHVTIEKDGEQLIFKAANEEAGALPDTPRAEDADPHCGAACNASHRRPVERAHLCANHCAVRRQGARERIDARSRRAQDIEEWRKQGGCRGRRQAYRRKSEGARHRR